MTKTQLTRFFVERIVLYRNIVSRWTRVFNSSCVFLAFFLRFSSRFGYQHAGIINARKSARKNARKNTRIENASETTHSVIRPLGIIGYDRSDQGVKSRAIGCSRIIQTIYWGPAMEELYVLYIHMFHFCFKDRLL